MDKLKEQENLSFTKKLELEDAQNLADKQENLTQNLDHARIQENLGCVKKLELEASTQNPSDKQEILCSAKKFELEQIIQNPADKHKNLDKENNLQIALKSQTDSKNLNFQTPETQDANISSNNINTDINAKVWIEPGCISCGACEFITPEVFEVTDRSRVRSNCKYNSGLDDLIEQAANACPVSVIKFKK